MTYAELKTGGCPKCRVWVRFYKSPFDSAACVVRQGCCGFPISGVKS